MPSKSPDEMCNTTKKQYLSPVAASTLANTYDDSCNSDNDGVPTPLPASPHSSAPPSPRGSVIGSSLLGGDGDNATSSTATTAAKNASSSLLAENDNLDDARGKLASKRSCYSRREDDPYADVRERMEALSLRDKSRHVYQNQSEAQPQNDDDDEASEKNNSMVATPSSHHEITIFAAITTYLGYVVLIVTGHIRDVCANIFRKGRYFRSNHMMSQSTTTSISHSTTATTATTPPPGHYPSDDFTKYAPLLKSWENFYTRRLYHRIQDCFNRPIASRPSAIISVLERVSFDGNKTMSVLGKLSNLEDEKIAVSYQMGKHYDTTPDGRVVRKCLNLGSYNYLGFADDWDITCRTDVMASLDTLPSSVGSSRLEFGTTTLHRRVENIVSSFVGKEDAMVLNMGFNTNATIIPTLTARGDLIVSDELNHTSIVNGARASGAAIRTFRHNDASNLEFILREAIVYGQPRTRRPWNRILVVVEGIYSMEGEYCNLRNVVTVCKKYGAYVYLDEAHSIGAMGPTGRGCCEYTGVDPADVDILMGTFTKSFGGMGGYVAADRRIIAELRRECAGSAYHNSLSPVVCQQIISSFQVRCWFPVVISLLIFTLSHTVHTHSLLPQR
jgi:serine palmitoyltransferase